MYEPISELMPHFFFVFLANKFIHEHMRRVSQYTHASSWAYVCYNKILHYTTGNIQLYRCSRRPFILSDNGKRHGSGHVVLSLVKARLEWPLQGASLAKDTWRSCAAHTTRPPPLGLTDRIQGNAGQYIWDQLGCRSCWKEAITDIQPPEGLHSWFVFWIYFHSLFHEWI